MSSYTLFITALTPPTTPRQYGSEIGHSSKNGTNFVPELEREDFFSFS